MPAGVLEVRGEICARCPTPCAEQPSLSFRADPCSACPLLHWGVYGRCQQILPARRGLGDLVAAVAQPIARVIDAAAGTKLAECGGCAKRRAALNRIHL